MAKRTILLAFALCVYALLPAQDNLSWKKHAKLADDLYKEGKYAEAADHYEKAWRQKSKKKEFIFNAGECYYLIKDYRKAAEAYRNVKDDGEDYPLVGLKYARSLKQDGQYDKAREAFNSFFASYSGESKSILEDIIKTEIAGCELGAKLPLQIDKQMEIRYPSGGVNSSSTEFAPFAFSDDVIYFSSTMGGKARIYRSQRQGTQWAKASLPENFPVIANEQHFCNGAVSPDGTRFYFTICSGSQSWSDLTTRCEIFVLKRRGSTWSQPERLPDYINMDKATATHPSVVHQAGREILYFVSNREGGRGGMDIWYSTRDLANEGSEFSFPVNIGSVVNTLGDEITPYFDAIEGTLYFASNGHVSIGGFDIFKSKGDGTRWANPENAGIPTNSGADDFGYTKNKSGAGGFLVSNRAFSGNKTSTRDEDIFEFSSGKKVISLKGSVYDEVSNEPTAATLTLYEVSGIQETEIARESFSDGAYMFQVQQNKTFKVSVESPGYETYSFRFTTDDPDLYVYGQPVYLKKPQENVFEATETSPKKESTKPKVGAATAEPYTSRDKNNFEIVTSAPKYEGAYYRIQLAALKKFNENDENYKVVKEMGTLVTEYIVDKKLTRVLLGDYFTQEEADAALALVKQQGFPKAYIVPYQDGERLK